MKRASFVLLWKNARQNNVISFRNCTRMSLIKAMDSHVLLSKDTYDTTVNSQGYGGNE